ncbi:MAG TPA: hypothetical protein VGJ95_21235 [Pseudonocardiaceae bacterium]
MQLEEVARELYAAPPGEFVAARNEYARQAKAAGDKQLADELRKLRRPTQSAWLVNLLLRQQRELVDELLDVGAEFRGEPLTRERLQELSTKRRELLQRLQVDAERLSAEAGMQLTADRAREVETTLAAAVADPDAAEQVRRGALVTPLSYSGLGPELQFVPQPRPAAALTGAAENTAPAEPLTDATTAAADRLDEADRDAAARRPGRGRADGRPTAGARAARPAEPDTGAAAERAARLVKQRTEAWQDAVRYRDGLVRRRDELRAEIRRIQQRLDRVENELADAEREAKAAEDGLEQARAAAGGPR